MKSGHETLALFPEVLDMFQEIYNGKYPKSMRLAVASSAGTPYSAKIARRALDMLEIEPGRLYWLL